MVKRQGDKPHRITQSGEFSIGTIGDFCTGIDTLAQSTSLSSKARAKHGDFDAIASIACAQIQNEDLGVCTAKIARGMGGDASIVIKFANSFARTLYFHNGVFERADATMSGVGTDTDWKTQEGIHHIRVDDQRFHIPVAFVTGEPE